jgi:hypothetical protein
MVASYCEKLTRVKDGQVIRLELACDVRPESLEVRGTGDDISIAIQSRQSSPRLINGDLLSSVVMRIQHSMRACISNGIHNLHPINT